MTNHGESLSDPTGSSSIPSAAGGAPSASDKAPEVAHHAADHAKDVALEATDQAKAVVGQAKDHVTTLLAQARSELASQADDRSQQAAAGLRSLSGQLAALRDGRPAAAGALSTYVGEAEQRVSALADRLQRGGAQGAIDDVTGFARRRPGLFLAGAVGLGFLVGRVARSGAAVAKEQHTPDPGSYRPVVAARLDPFVETAPVDPFVDAPAHEPVLDPPLGDPLLATPTVAAEPVYARLDSIP